MFPKSLSQAKREKSLATASFCVSQCNSEVSTEQRAEPSTRRLNWDPTDLSALWWVNDWEEYQESSEPLSIMSFTLHIGPECCFDISLVDFAASASYLILLFSDIARSCLDRPVVFLLTLSSITSILVARRSWTRASVVVNSSWRCS